MSLMPTGSPASGRAARPGCLGCALRMLEVERGERTDLEFARGDRVRAQIDHPARRKVTGRDPAGEIECREHQAMPSIKATMRSVMWRAAGMMM